MCASKNSEFLKKLKYQNFDTVVDGILREESLKSGQNPKINACAKLYLEVEQADYVGQDDQRLEKLENLLRNKTIKRTAADFEHFPEVGKLEYRPCAGKYESCSKNEITEEQLRCLHNSLPTQEISTSSSLRQSSIGNFLRTPLPGAFRPRETPPVQEVKPVNQSQPFCGFRSARDELRLQNIKKYGRAGLSQTETSNPNSLAPSTIQKGKSLGMRQYVKPTPKPVEEPPQDERLAHIDPRMVELIESEIMRKQETISWDDIAGLEYAKSVIEEIVIASLLRPDLYKGLRRPPRGVLLFGPPGTGKTLIGRCIASQSNSTFFSISSSTITSKYVGDSEKMVRALFAVAAVHQPAVIFIDEIDSMLCKRSENEQDYTRRLKNEFLVQLDGATTSEDDRIVVVGATNRPQELDDAARRRLVRRLYIPLPDVKARIDMIKNLLTKVKHDLTLTDIEEAANQTDGYSCADLKSVLHEAALKPLRGIPYSELISCTEDRVRPVNKGDIRASLRTVRPTVAKADLAPYLEWNKLYGTIREDEVEDDN